MDSILIALLTTSISLALTIVSPLRAADKKPNIIVIVADDLGYADLSCQGSHDIRTPNIDTLAANGVRCTSGYVSCPVCSPTRAGLLTGRYQQRFGHEFNPGPPKAAPASFGLSLEERTIADRLKAAGYKTGMVGKWHQGYTPPFHPLKRGFDEFFGFPGGAHSYVDAEADPLNPILQGTNKVQRIDYTTDDFTREAVAFVDRHKTEPFFLYLPYNAVHTPMEVLEKYRTRFPDISDRKRRTFAAMLAALDDGVGEVLKKLHEEKLVDNSLIFFISDNGGPTAKNTSRNDPLRGVKSQVWEGGIRVPFIVQWKGHLPSGKIYEKPVIALDILPTALAAAAAPVSKEDKIDGVDLMPFLSGKNEEPPHRSLFWRYGAQSAVRSLDWKLVKIGNEPPKLFNLADDIAEKNDLAAKEPDILKSLQISWTEWNSQLIPAKWRQVNQEERSDSVKNQEPKTKKKKKKQ